MNDKQLEQAKKELREQREKLGTGFNAEGKWENHDTPEIARREKELYCIDMINSILAYGGFGFTAEQVFENEHNSYHNYLEDYEKVFTKDEIIKLIQGQIDSIERIDSCVYTDNEGCTYNSIVYKN